MRYDRSSHDEGTVMTEVARLSIDNALEVSGVYASMLDRISEKLPSTILDSENFNKSASQFKAATLDITDLTPINSAKHLLAVITRTRQALEEAEVSLRKKRLEYRRLNNQLNDTTDQFEREELQISMDEIENHIANAEASARGAIRKLHFNINQYNNILDHLGVDAITEEMYEQDQARYHVMTAFNQALCAARARGGFIDEGNHIYFFQLGINGAVAQMEIDWLINTELELIRDGKAPTHKMVTNWLDACAQKYAVQASEYAARRGLTTLDTTSLLHIEKGNSHENH